MPSGGAGLIRFFEDETPGIKVGPTTVVILASILVIATVISHVLYLFGNQLELSESLIQMEHALSIIRDSKPSRTAHGLVNIK